MYEGVPACHRTLATYVSLGLFCISIICILRQMKQPRPQLHTFAFLHLPAFLLLPALAGQSAQQLLCLWFSRERQRAKSPSKTSMSHALHRWHQLFVGRRRRRLGIACANIPEAATSDNAFSLSLPLLLWPRTRPQKYYLYM